MILFNYLNTKEKFNSVCNYLNLLGIEIVFSSDYAKFNCPFSSYLGIDYNNKIIFVKNDCTNKKLKESIIGGIIHEAGHIVASLQEPKCSEEWLFHGWEYVVAIKCNVVNEWLNSNYDYGCGDKYNFKHFGQLTEYEKTKFIAEIIILATEIGLIKNGEPVALR